MKKDKFVKLVLKALPGFANKGSFFYSLPFEHVLNGFFCEITPNGAYIWRFFYPLFDKFNCFHLTYSYRFPGEMGFIDFNDIPREAFAEEFLLRISGYLEDARRPFSLTQFIDYAIGQQFYMNAHARMGLGFACALEGNIAQAVEYLRKAAEHLRGPKLLACSEVLGLIDADLALAKVRILEFEVETKKLIGI